MIKILFSDIDGTLTLPREKQLPNKTISDENIAAIKKLYENGGKFCIASGRNPNATQKIADEIGIEIDQLCCNGAIMFTSGEKTEINLPLEKVKVLDAFVKRHAPDGSLRYLAVMSDSYVYYLDYFDEYWVMPNGKIKYNSPSNVTIKDVLDFPDQYPKVLKLMLEITDGRYEYWRSVVDEELSDIFDIGSSIPSKIEFMEKNVNKGEAIRFYQKYYGIADDEIAVIGDADNDIPMLKKAKYSYVVSTGEEKAKSMAYKIVDSVAECIEDCLRMK